MQFGHFGLLLQLVLPLDFFGRLFEIVKPERFEQIVQSIDLKALDGILTISRGEDHYGRCFERADEFHSANVGHLDVGEDGIDAFALQVLCGFGGTLDGRNECESFSLFDVSLELFQSQRFVVDD